MQQQITVNNLALEIAQTAILDDVSVTIHRGEFVGIIGPNGSGKTTLLNCMAGLMPRMTGDILLNDKAIDDFNARQLARVVAYLHQENPEELNLKVHQVVALGLLPRMKLFSAIKQQHREDIQHAIDLVGLTDKTNHAFETLSGGEKQRCLLAKVIVQRPEILLMDEPTNHLDIHYQVAILALVKRLGITVIASFHDLNLAAAYCDKLICLQQGRVIAEGHPQQVLNTQLLTTTFKVPVAVDTNPLNDKQRISFNLWSDQHEID